MYSVAIGSARLPAPIDRLRYVEQLPGWACLWLYGGYEIELRISGGEESPDGRAVALTELILPHLEALEAVADACLRSFFTHTNEFDAPWTLQKVRLGMPAPWHGAATEFDVMLANRGDDDGEWGVGSRRHSIPRAMVAAESFFRKQW